MIFSLKVLKNYIVRCDFWSWRHLVARLKFFYFCTVNIVTLCGGNVYSNVFDTAVKADVFGDTFFGLSKSFISSSELPESSVTFALIPFTPLTPISDVI